MTIDMHTQASTLERFQDWEQQRASEPCLTQPYPDGSVVDYTWAQVGEQARRMATYLRSLDFPPGSCIALLGRNSAHWLIAELAIMMAGHVSVPIYATASADSARYMLDHAQARLLFLGKLDGTADNWPQIEPALPPGLPLIALPMSPRRDIPQWDEVVAGHAPLSPVHAPGPDEPRTIIYTSGSTGVPKGALHSYGSMLANVCAMAEVAGGLLPHERIVTYLPLAHVAERIFVATVFHHGGRIYFSNNLATFAEDLRRARPTLFFSVPRLWIKFQQAVNAKLPPSRQRLLFSLPIVSHLVKRKVLRGLGLDHARITFTGSAPLPAEIVAWYRNLGLEMLEGYGQTECCISHCSRPGQVRPGYVGPCVPGVEMRIDAQGELLVRTPARMLGYYKEPELTARAETDDGFWRTGDLAEVDAQGRVRITGRVKELFKTQRGEYVAPSPIEDRLAVHPRLEGVCVTGPDRPRPLALLAPSVEARQALADGTVSRQQLEAEFTVLLRGVNATLPGHEKLAFVVITRDAWTAENGLLTPTLKIRRDQIERRYLPNVPAWEALNREVVWE